MIPAGVEVTCPACDNDFTTQVTLVDGDYLECSSCNIELIVVEGDLRIADEEEDIYDDSDNPKEEK